nr:hypothetical protein CFP56_04952 [Quercus suber]
MSTDRLVAISNIHRRRSAYLVGSPSVVDFIVLKGDMVESPSVVDVVPLLDPDLVSPSSRLRRHECLQVSDGVVLVALHSHLLP